MIAAIRIAAALLFAAAAPAAAVTLSESDAPGGAFSADRNSPTVVPAGIGSVAGTGLANRPDIFRFEGLPTGPVTLSFVFEAPATVGWSYAAGGQILWREDPFRWDWDGAYGPAFHLDYYTRERTVSLTLPEDFAGALHLALMFTYGQLSYGIDLPVLPTLDDVPAASRDPVAAVPVPAAALLLPSALAALLLAFRRRREDAPSPRA